MTETKQKITEKELILERPQGDIGPYRFTCGNLCGRERRGGLAIYVPERREGADGPHYRSAGVLTREQAVTLHNWLGEAIKTWGKDLDKNAAVDD